MLAFNIIVPLVKTVLRWLGVGAVTYMGINLALDTLYTQIVDSFQGADPAVAMLMGIARLDVAINIYMTAILTKFVMAGLDKASGTISRFKSGYKFEA